MRGTRASWLASLCAVAVLGAPAVASALAGAVIVRSDTLERTALDPWVVLADGTRLDLSGIAMALSATAHEPRFLVIGDLSTGRTRELPYATGFVSFEAPDGTQDLLTNWIAPEGSLAYWPGGSQTGDPADAEILSVVHPDGEAFELRRPTPLPEPSRNLAVSLAALLLAVCARGRRER